MDAPAAETPNHSNESGIQQASVPSQQSLHDLPLACGYVMLVLSIIFNGWRYNLESAAMHASTGPSEGMSPFGVLMVGPYAAAIVFLLVGWTCRQLHVRFLSLHKLSIKSCVDATRCQGWAILLAALGATCGGWFLTQANKLYGPEFVAFLGNLMPVLLVFIGLFEGERLRIGELLAIVIIIAGAFVFSYTDGHLNWAGVGLMVIGCSIMAVKKTLMKHATGADHLPSVMAVSVMLSGTWGLIGGLATHTLILGGTRSVLLCVAGGLAGAMIGMSLLYAGLNVVGLARGAPIDSLRPLAVLAIALIGGAPLPATYRLIGGAMVLIGSVLLARMGTQKSKETRERDIEGTSPSIAVLPPIASKSPTP